MSEVKVEWVVVKVDKVARFYAAAFKPEPGRQVISHEVWIDTARAEVIYRLITAPKERVPK